MHHSPRLAVSIAVSKTGTKLTKPVGDPRGNQSAMMLFQEASSA